MKKKILSILSAAVIACSVTAPMIACGNNDDGVEVGDDGTMTATKITMWVGGSEWSGRNYQNLKNFINYYNSIKPDGFEVQLDTPKSDLEKSFQTSRTSGSQPDVMLWDRFNTATFGTKYLYGVNDLIERDELDTSIFYQPAMQEMTYDGVAYGLPIDIDVWGTYVNMKFVEQYDAKQTDASAKIASRLNANWTWDDLLVSAKALKTVCNAGYSSGDQYQHLFKYYVSTGHGDEYLKPANDGVKGKYVTNFDNDWTKSILNYFKEVNAADVGGTQEDDSFTSEILAMVNKPLYYNNTIKLYPKVDNYKFLPQPRPDTEGGVNGGMIGGYGIAYPAPMDKFKTQAWEARHEAAWKFTKWLCTNKDAMLKWTVDIGSLPALTEALDADECVANNQVLADARSYVKATDSNGDLVYMTRPQVPNFLTLQTDVINHTVRSFINGDKTLDDCISDLTSNGNSKLSQGLN
ncbi:MAG: extracellular solute-binding protein [Clostridiales bacterium]|nr:extracellular solute-binding protein [Clostridiales bacterium]